MYVVLLSELFSKAGFVPEILAVYNREGNKLLVFLLTLNIGPELQLLSSIGLVNDQ